MLEPRGAGQGLPGERQQVVLDAGEGFDVLEGRQVEAIAVVNDVAPEKHATVGLVLTILTFPLILLTLGLFSFVVNAIVILLVAFLVPGLSINGFLPALIAAIVLSSMNMFWKAVTAPRGMD